MPIRLRDSNAFIGRISSALESATAAVVGAHTAPAARQGTIVTRLDDHVAGFVGLFQPAPNSTGTIVSTLSGVTSNELGTASPPPIPNRTGTIATTLQGSVGALSGAITSPVTSDWWPNYPIMSVCAAQGDIADNLGNSAMWPYIADHDVHMFQWANPTVSRLTNRCNWIDGVRALQSGGIRTRFFMYVNLNQTIKDQVAADTPWMVNRDFIQSATEGNPNWYLHRAAPNQAQVLEPNFEPTNNRQCNMARGGGLNSLGEAYWKVFFRKWKALLGTGNPSTDLLSRLSGYFFDNFNQRVPNIWTSNGATAVTDYDMDDNGTADSRADYSATGGSGRWARGHLDAKAEFEAQHPGLVAMVNSGEWDGDWINGSSSPPLPFSNAPFYRNFELLLAESRHLSLGFAKTSTAYQLTPGSLSRLYRGLEMQKQMLKPDPNGLTGRASTMMHTNTVDRVTLTQDDYEYARLFLGLSLLIEGCCHSITSGASRPVPLDERNLYLGSPLAPRTMGTLNDTTGAFTARVAMLTIGVAQFWWVECSEGAVVLRGDYPVGPYPRVWPSSDAAVSFPLSTQIPAGAGFKWQNPNGATYVNPRTGRAMRNLSPAINNGADVTSLSMRPMTVRFVRRVPA